MRPNVRLRRTASRLVQSFLVCLIVVPCVAANDDDFKKAPSFNRDIRPLLSDRCFLCHGPDESSRQADFRFDLRESAIGPAASGDAPIVPGDAEASELIARITSDDPDLQMPPPEAKKKPLTEEEIDTIRRWVAAGAEYQPHWSFIPPAEVPLPQPPGAEWCQNEIDHFVLNRQRERQWGPAPPADRRTLIRRVTFDLTGLPPTLEEVDAFVNDESPDAYERLVDRLLDSPHYGEHMARFWLDAVRYGDTHGLHLDNYREAWPYRDWVIRAFNENLPFDRMTVMQLAGDLLPDATTDDLVASGFNRMHVTTNEGGSIVEEVDVRNVVDRVSTAGTVFLGLTVGCAVCHDHKYDPITQEDFYSLYAFFNNLDGNPMDGNTKDPAPVIRVPNEEQAAMLAQLNDQIAALNQQLTADSPELDAAQQQWEAEWRRQYAAQWQPLQPTEWQTEHGSEINVIDDQSIEIAGENPHAETIELSAVSPDEFLALRLEGLLPEGDGGAGVGRSPNGNVVLSEIELESRPAGSGEEVEFQKHIFVRAVADHSQPNFPVAAAIDGQVDQATGWAVEGHHRRENRVAYFMLAEPITAGAEIRVRLRFVSQFAQHVFRKIRLSFGNNPEVWPVTSTDWHVLGPIKSDDGRAAFDEKHSPETNSPIDLSQSVGADNLAWTQQTLPDGQIHKFETTIGSWYFYRRIHSPSARDVTLRLGSDDAIKVWLNGAAEPIHVNNVARGVQPDQDRINVSLRPGENELLVKVVNFGGDTGLYFKLDDSIELADAMVMQILEQDPSARSSENAAVVRDYFRQRHWPEFKQLSEQIKAAEAEKTALEQLIPTTLVMKEKVEMVPAYLLKRGEYDQPDKDRGEMSRRVPEFLPPLPEDAQTDRLALAQWLIAPEQPLTARVAVNRFWQQFFGSGIVKTSEDFGSQGSWPTHPDLLDWLALEFRRSGWDVKHIMKRIAMSATYQQSSRINRELLVADPKNDYHTRGPRFRLDAEMIRDQALATSGLLVRDMGGPGVKPPQPPGLWEAVGYVGSNTQIFQPDTGAEKVYRRSVYTFWKRTSAPPQMATFDAPTREECVVRRERTNTPLQALMLLNEQQFLQAARHLAQNVWLEQKTPDSVARTLFARITSRYPEPAELAELEKLYAQQLQFYTDHAEARDQLVQSSQPEPDSQMTSATETPLDAVQSSELAAWTVVTSVIFNLDEVVTKE